MTDADLIARIAAVLPAVLAPVDVDKWPEDERDLAYSLRSTSLAPTDIASRVDQLRREKAARKVLDVLGIDDDRYPGSERWDIGDPEPVGVLSVDDQEGNDEENCCSGIWSKTSNGDWKGYKAGGKTYLSWAELVRRWGPVKEAE